MNRLSAETNILEQSKILVAATPKRYLRMKRVQDVMLSLAALIVFLPLMLLIALLIWLESPGASPIFSQERVGKDGKIFRFYKFRSMCPDAEQQREALEPLNEMDGPVFKIKEDPRITRVGKILRKTSMDELPQLWNVLRGEMSLVGPRPALPKEVAQYDEKALCRLLVTPGLTCYWQTQSERNELSFDTWMDLDLKYIRQRSFSEDWKILFATVGAVLSLSGE